MTAASLLRSARGSHGLSQRALADRSRVAQPRIAEIEAGAHDTTVSRLEQLLASLGQRVAVLPTRSRPACEAALAAAEELAAGSESQAWREIIQLSDDLAGASPAVRVALCVTEPAPTRDNRYDALVAAIVDHWLTTDRLPLPEWVRTPQRTLTEPWDVEPLASLRPAARKATPKAIARHGIYLPASELASV
jgi:transcriptional regulator with XRE-family HTH domain